MRVSTDVIESTLRTLVSAPLRTAGPDDAVQGVQPQWIVEPATEAEVAAVLAFADREGLKVLPRGGGTQMAFGFPPSEADLVLSTARLNRVLEHHPHDQTVTAEAGVRLTDLQAQLATTRQWLALDPVLAPEATVGGIVATNPSGARRLRFGGVRDQIIGIRVALADGTLASGGGKVVKNVAGYDLPKLFTGSLGTLGIVVSATFRLYPLPTVTRTVLFTAPSPEPLCALVRTVLASPLVPTALEVLGPAAPDAPCTLAVRFESGVAAAVEDQSATLLMLAGDLASSAHAVSDAEESDFWRQIDESLRPNSADGDSLLLKASLLPTEVAGWLARLGETATTNALTMRYRAHAGNGLCHVRLAGPPAALVIAIEPLREAAVATRGSLVVLEAATEIARQIDVWGAVSALSVMRNLKAQFDPHATLNPGRFVGGI